MHVRLLFTTPFSLTQISGLQKQKHLLFKVEIVIFRSTDRRRRR